MLSKTSVHALRALIVMAQMPAETRTGAARLAEQIGAPPNYLSKLLQQLVREGILTSQKGATGGFSLARPASEITIFNIVAPLDQLERWDCCILGKAHCSGDEPCALHHRYGEIRQAYQELLKGTSLEELATGNTQLALEPLTT